LIDFKELPEKPGEDEHAFIVAVLREPGEGERLLGVSPARRASSETAS
jgi:hypothetical protein